VFNKCNFCGSHQNIISDFRGAKNPYELSPDDVLICLRCSEDFYSEIGERSGVFDDNETVFCDFCRWVHPRAKSVVRLRNAICVFDLQTLKDLQHESTRSEDDRKRFNYGFGAWYEQGETVICTVTGHFGRLGQSCYVTINEYNIPARLICGSYFKFDIGEEVLALVSTRNELGLLTLIPRGCIYFCRACQSRLIPFPKVRNDLVFFETRSIAGR
jgi:hypothetical protein